MQVTPSTRRSVNTLGGIDCRERGHSENSRVTHPADLVRRPDCGTKMENHDRVMCNPVPAGRKADGAPAAVQRHISIAGL
jgi:hypothetical protein